MARGPSSTPQRPVFLLIGEDPFRARLRLAELVTALAGGAATEPGDLSTRLGPAIAGTLGVTRHDAREAGPEAIELSGRSQGLFDAPDERRVVVVENAEAIKDTSFVQRFPWESALVMLMTEAAPARGRRARRKGPSPPPAGPEALVDAVEEAGGKVERISRLAPDSVMPWINSRAALLGLRLEPAAVAEIASAVGSDTARIDQELGKLAAFARGEQVSVADVRALVPGAIEAEVFDLTRAVVRRDARAAVATLERLLEDGQAPQQILALLLWQFRVLLFASAMKNDGDAQRMAAAIRSSAGAIARWRGDARRVTRADVTRAYESLYATDLAIKQGRTEPETALTLCVLDLCGVANADPRELVVGEPPRR